VASTKDRQRALERARYERVQGKIQQKRREAQRKKRLAVFAVVVAVIAAGAVTAGFALAGNSNTTVKAAATGSAAASAAATASGTPCPQVTAVADETKGFVKCGSAAKDVGVPTYTAAGATSYTATITTNLGNIVFTADGKDAPYTVESFVYLAGKDYFDNTKCHRLVTSSIYVLQCGDPTGTGSGTPGYVFQDENLASLGKPDAAGHVTYKAGTVAMANSGPGTNGSQFFLVYKDSPLGPNYTPFGTITQGMDILTQVAAKGSNNANGDGDGAPNESVQIEKVTIKQG
jgi:peptidyl-prolyl cis-trans isomerase B (cyclophilin B)